MSFQNFVNHTKRGLTDVQRRFLQGNAKILGEKVKKLGEKKDFI